MAQDSRSNSVHSNKKTSGVQESHEQNALNPTEVLYLHGHDHVMQHFRESEHEVHHLGNGVGGMGLHPLKNCSNCSEFQWGTSAHGFAVHELAKDFLATHFVDAETHEVLHSVVIPF